MKTADHDEQIFSIYSLMILNIYRNGVSCRLSEKMVAREHLQCLFFISLFYSLRVVHALSFSISFFSCIREANVHSVGVRFLFQQYVQAAFKWLFISRYQFNCRRPLPTDPSTPYWVWEPDLCPRQVPFSYSQNYLSIRKHQ